MIGLLARLAARGAGRSLAGAPPQLAAPVRPRFAPPETGGDQEIGHSVETGAANGPAAPATPRQELEDDPRVSAASGSIVGERRSDPAQDGQARSEASPAQADVSRLSNRIAGPAVDRSRPAPPDTAAPVPERDEPARSAAPPPAPPPVPSSAPPGSGGGAPPRIGQAPTLDSDKAPRPAPEPQTEPQIGDMGAPDAAEAGTYMLRHATMDDPPHALDPAAADATTGPPPPRLSIGRIDVIFEAAQPPPAVRRRGIPERTRGFSGFDRARLGLRR